MTEEPEEDDGEAGYELVVPFVACVSEGGPYDEAAFVAGVRMRAVWHALEAGPARYESYQNPGLVPQPDLVAMHFGYTMASEPDSEEWTLCTFTKAPAGPA